MLEQLFGADTAFTDNTHNDRGWGPRTFASFKVAADEAAISRMYAGIHFRSGIEGGKVQGRCVAQQALGLQPRVAPADVLGHDAGVPRAAGGRHPAGDQGGEDAGRLELPEALPAREAEGGRRLARVLGQ